MFGDGRGHVSFPGTIAERLKKLPANSGSRPPSVGFLNWLKHHHLLEPPFVGESLQRYMQSVEYPEANLLARPGRSAHARISSQRGLI